MLFRESYLTVRSPAEGIYRDRGSKFIARVFPVKSEPEIRELIAQVRKEHPAARHCCCAWRLGAGGEAFRTNDDGEPSGTAGKPIFGQIQSHDLTFVLITVVRYFGGTLLGVGGLINAYREAAADAVKNADIEEKFILHEYRIEFPYEDTGSVMHLLKETDARIIAQEYDVGNAVRFTVKRSRSEQLEERIKQLYRTKLTYIRTL